MELTQIERSQLLAYVETDGFKIFCQILRDEVLKFNAELLAAKKPDDVIFAHNQASTATRFYEGALDRIEAERFTYSGIKGANDPPVDATEGMLDLDSKEEGWTDK